MATAFGAVAGLFLFRDVGAQTCTPDFLITPTPNGPRYNRLKAVTAFDVNDVWAVGSTNGTDDQTLTEHWDGLSWTIVPSPNQGVFSQLSGVGGIATDDLWAVGSFIEDVGFHPSRTLTEHWDGTRWSVVPSPSLQGFDQLNAVAAVATDDVWAVGQDSAPNPLFLHWDGQVWSLIDAPADAGPQSAVVAIASDDVWSAGSGRRPGNTGLFNHWDGTSWTNIPNPPLTPGAATIKGLSATASNDVWAVGSLFYELCEKTCYDSEAPRVLHWDGQSWAIASTPTTFFVARLSGASAESSASVWSVGSGNGHAFASHWDGSAWTDAPSLQLGFGSLFEGVAAIGGDAWAVGWFAITGRDQTLAARYRCN